MAENDIYDVLENTIRRKVKMESALRRIEIIADQGSVNLEELCIEIVKIAHEGLQPPIKGS